MDKEEITKLKKELDTQDNLSTANPIFVVYDWEKVYGLDPSYSDDYIWINSQGEESSEEDVKEEGEEGCKKVYYKKVRRFISVFFTRKSAQAFIKANRYHWDDPHIYVESLWRNYEMQEIRNHFQGEGAVCSN